MRSFKENLTEKPEGSSKADHSSQSDRNMTSDMPPTGNQASVVGRDIESTSSGSYSAPNDDSGRHLLQTELPLGLNRSPVTSIDRNPPLSNQDQNATARNTRNWGVLGWKAWLFRHPYVLIIMMPLILAFVQETVGGDNSHEDLQIAAINEQLGNLAKVSSPGAFLAYELSISAFPLQDAADEVEAQELVNGGVLVHQLRNAVKLVDKISKGLTGLSISGATVIDTTIATQSLALSKLQVIDRWNMIPPIILEAASHLGIPLDRPTDASIRKWLLVTLEELLEQTIILRKKAASVDRNLEELVEALARAKGNGVKILGDYEDSLEEISLWYRIFGAYSVKERRYTRNIATLNGMDGTLGQAREVVSFTLRTNQHIAEQVGEMYLTLNNGSFQIGGGGSIRRQLQQWGRSARRLAQIDAAAQEKKDRDINRIEGGLHKKQIERL